jgi:hypothetical protein
MRQFPFRNESPSIHEHIPVLRNAKWRVAAESETERFVNLVKETLVINVSRFLRVLLSTLLFSAAWLRQKALSWRRRLRTEQPSISTSIPALAEFKKALLDLGLNFQLNYTGEVFGNGVIDPINPAVGRIRDAAVFGMRVGTKF